MPVAIRIPRQAVGDAAPYEADGTFLRRAGPVCPATVSACVVPNAPVLPPVILSERSESKDPDGPRRREVFLQDLSTALADARSAQDDTQGGAFPLLSRGGHRGLASAPAREERAAAGASTLGVPLRSGW